MVEGRAAHADPRPRAHLEYLRDEGADACPDELALRNAAAARLGSDPFWPVAPLRISVVMEGAEGQLRARVLVRDAESGKRLGTRTLRSQDADCSELFAAMVLAVCIAIDPESATRDVVATSGAPGAADEAPRPEAASGPPVSQRPSVDAVARSAAPPSTNGRVEPQVTLGALLALGTSPMPAPGLFIGVALRYRAFSLGLEARGDLPIDKDLGRGELVQAAPLLIGAVPCVHFAGGLALCPVGYVGALRGNSSTGDGDAQVTPLVLLGGRAATEVPLNRSFFLRVHADIVGNLTPTEIHVAGVERWTTPAVAAATGLAAARRF
jgi:hypothetical protein